MKSTVAPARQHCRISLEQRLAPLATPRFELLRARFLIARSCVTKGRMSRHGVADPPQEWGNTATRNSTPRIGAVLRAPLNACRHATYGYHELVTRGEWKML